MVTVSGIQINNAMTAIESLEMAALPIALLNPDILVLIPPLLFPTSVPIPISMLAVMASLNKIIMKLVMMETQTLETVAVLTVLSKLIMFV